MLIHDTAQVAGRSRTPEGFLRVRARIARTGIHLYRADELGRPPGFTGGDTVRVFRPPEAVFGDAAMASFAGKPVTDGHPPAMVDAANWKRYAVGQSGPAVVRDGDHLVAELTIADAAAVTRVEAGAQLSNGYLADFDFTPGTTPAGESYDAVQSNIRGNHIALVEAGRCGETCRVGDTGVADCGCPPSPDLVTVDLDGVSVAVAPAGMAALDRLRARLEEQAGTIAALTARVPDAAALDALVAERAGVIERARAVLGAGFDPHGLDTAAVRRAVVARALGQDLVGRSDSYVAAAFDALAATAGAAPNPLARHLATTDAGASGDLARRARDRFLTTAWKGEATGAP